jgi:hypothetical protein
MYSKGDQLKVKLTNLKPPKANNLGYFLFPNSGDWCRRRVRFNEVAEKVPEEV